MRAKKSFSIMTDRRIWLVILLLEISLVNGGLEGTRAGPFKLKVKTFQQCPTELKGLNTVRFDDLSVTVLNRTTKAVDGPVQIGRELTDDCQVQCILTQLTKSHGNELRNPVEVSNEEGPFCTSFRKYLPSFFDAVLHQLKLTSCPITKMTAQIDDLPLIFKVPDEVQREFFYGTYYSTFVIKCHEGTVGCARFMVDVIPK